MNECVYELWMCVHCACAEQQRSVNPDWFDWLKKEIQSECDYAKYKTQEKNNKLTTILSLWGDVTRATIVVVFFVSALNCAHVNFCVCACFFVRHLFCDFRKSFWVAVSFFYRRLSHKNRQQIRREWKRERERKAHRLILFQKKLLQQTSQKANEPTRPTDRPTVRLRFLSLSLYFVWTCK